MCFISINFCMTKNFKPEKFINDCSIDKEGYNLVFNDEFDTGYLDTNKWRPKMYWSGNLYPKERQYWFDENDISFNGSNILLKFTPTFLR